VNNRVCVSSGSFLFDRTVIGNNPYIPISYGIAEFRETYPMNSKLGIGTLSGSPTYIFLLYRKSQVKLSGIDRYNHLLCFSFFDYRVSEASVF
jgi:hypothetical protein